MKSVRCDLGNGVGVLLVSEVFPKELLIKLVELVDQFKIDNPDWTVPPEFAGRPRYVYTGNSPTNTELKEFLESDEFLTELNNQLGTTPKLIDYKIWIDLAGFGRLLPHVEAWGDYLGQIYIGRQEHPTGGTTIYDDQKRILFQMPYRINYGWIFDQCQHVWHGRKQDIPEGLVRASVMLWYNL